MAQPTQLPDGSVAIIKSPEEANPETTRWGSVQQWTLLAGIGLSGMYYGFQRDLQGAIGILTLFGIGGGVAGAQGHKAAADASHQVVVVRPTEKVESQP